MEVITFDWREPDIAENVLREITERYSLGGSSVLQLDDKVNYYAAKAALVKHQFLTNPMVKSQGKIGQRLLRKYFAAEREELSFRKRYEVIALEAFLD